MPSANSQSLEASLNLKGDVFFDLQFLNKLVRLIDVKLKPLEDQSADVQAALLELRQVALDRINEVLTPAIQSVLIMQERGFLIARSATSATLDEGDILTFTIDDEVERETFAPAPFVALTREDEFDDFGIARVHSYNKDTGALVCEVLALGGDPGPHDDWVIGALGGSTVAQMAMLDEAKDARDEAVAAKEDAVTARRVATRARDIAIDPNFNGVNQVAQLAADALASKNAATASSDTATTQAGIATTKAAEAAASAASVTTTLPATIRRKALAYLLI